MKWLFNHSQETIDQYNQLNKNDKAIFDRLHSSPFKKTPGHNWTGKDANTYGTQKIFEDILPTGKHPYDIRLSWSYDRTVDYKIKQGYHALFEICPWIDPYFHRPYDYRQGMNNTIIPIDTNVEKSRKIVNEKKKYKPSVQHIVPQALGGPTDDVENIMIMPLRYNELYSDMSPEERYEMIKALTDPHYKQRIAQAESKFYRPKLVGFLPG